MFLTTHTNSEPTGTAFGPIIYYVAGRPASYQLARALSLGATPKPPPWCIQAVGEFIFC